MKSNILLTIGISIVVLLSALSAFNCQHSPKTPPQTEIVANP